MPATPANLDRSTIGFSIMSTAKPLPKTPIRSQVPGREMPAATPQVAWNDPSQHTPLAILGGLMLRLIAAYWDMFALISKAWGEDLYSHGWIVPLLAAGLLWLRWEPFGAVPQSERWLGVGLVALGLTIRLLA